MTHLPRCSRGPGMGLDHVRRLLGHASISMALRYSSLVAADLQRAHRDAGALERMPSESSPQPRSRQPRVVRAPSCGLPRADEGRG